MKYEVTYVEKNEYIFEVEADDEIKAKEKVYEMTEQMERDQLRNHFHDSDARVESVYEIEGGGS